MTGQTDFGTRRAVLAAALAVLNCAVYFGYILMVAYAREFLGTLILPGLSWGIFFGAIVIVAAFLMEWYYVRWHTRHWDLEGRGEAAK
jgi:uncharacterized membrane protein (DUF485 family)